MKNILEYSLNYNFTTKLSYIRSEEKREEGEVGSGVSMSAATSVVAIDGASWLRLGIVDCGNTRFGLDVDKIKLSVGGG